MNEVEYKQDNLGQRYMTLQMHDRTTIHAERNANRETWKISHISKRGFIMVLDSDIPDRQIISRMQFLYLSCVTMAQNNKR